MKRSTKLKVIKLARENNVSIKEMEKFLIKEGGLFQRIGNLGTSVRQGFSMIPHINATRNAVSSGVVDQADAKTTFNMTTGGWSKSQTGSTPKPFGNMTMGDKMMTGTMALGAGKLFMDSRQKKEEEEKKKKSGGPIIIQS